MNQYNDRGIPHGFWEHTGHQAFRDFSWTYMGYYDNGNEIGLWIYEGTDGEIKEFFL